MNNLASTGIDAKKHPILVNTVSVSAHYTVNKIGTITATLGSNLGFWIPMLNWKVNMEETEKLQGFDPERIHTDAVSERQLGRNMGNTFRQHVVVSILKVMLPAVGMWQKPTQ